MAAQERDDHVATWEPRAALCPGSYRVRSGRSAQKAERWGRLHTLHRRDFPGLPRSAGTVRGWTAKLLADVWGTDQDDEAGNAVWFQITSTGRDTPAKQDASAGRTLTTAVPDAGRRDRAE